MPSSRPEVLTRAKHTCESIADLINQYDFCGVYCGIILGQCASISYDAGSADDLRGGRLVEIHQDDPTQIRTYMVRLRSIMGEAADNRGRP